MSFLKGPKTEMKRGGHQWYYAIKVACWNTQLTHFTKQRYDLGVNKHRNLVENGPKNVNSCFLKRPYL